jgi:plasmid maintenance system antidote protein VapI
MPTRTFFTDSVKQLPEHGTTYAFAKALHVSLPRLNNTVQEERAISPDLAVLLSVYFDTT